MHLLHTPQAARKVHCGRSSIKILSPFSRKGDPSPQWTFTLMRVAWFSCHDVHLSFGVVFCSSLSNCFSKLESSKTVRFDITHKSAHYHNCRLNGLGQSKRPRVNYLWLQLHLFFLFKMHPAVPFPFVAPGKAFAAHITRKGFLTGVSAGVCGEMVASAEAP